MRTSTLVPCALLVACQVVEDHRHYAFVELESGDACARLAAEFRDPYEIRVGASDLLVMRGGSVSFSFLGLTMPGTVTLSSDNVAQGITVTLDGSTFRSTKASNEPNDPIAGTATVIISKVSDGKLHVDLDGVVLQSPDDRSLCTLDGTIRALGTHEP